ncbi:MAG: hypothetical protein SW833_15255 [Cyanobacteriota bacterium]|nr:hypothetical protein [Cyanobacteriota bacterium]
MLAINLDDEAEKYLIEILARERMTSQQLVKKLLRDYLENPALSNQRILERRRSHSEHLLESEEYLADLERRKRIILNQMREKYKK